MEDAIDWIKENWFPYAIVLSIVLIIAAVIYGAIENDKLNKSMIGKPRSALVETFGPPTRTAPTYQDSEVIEWVRHIPGYFQSQWISNGRGGGYSIMIWIPEHDVIRRAIVRNNRVTQCGGGF